MKRSKLSANLEEQRNRLLDALRKHPVTTLYARINLDVFHPAARVQELREIGFNIVTERTVVDSGKGMHRVASYVLLSEIKSQQNLGNHATNSIFEGGFNA